MKKSSIAGIEDVRCLRKQKAGRDGLGVQPRAGLFAYRMGRGQPSHVRPFKSIFKQGGRKEWKSLSSFPTHFPTVRVPRQQVAPTTSTIFKSQCLWTCIQGRI
ncbi:hypothetical protein CDAR_105201 [Caerostris darwini]|uniref:Uncharacterized protein n=1 Tax=Caerostris darwini TaxID=1538125 RepID=A0AAV4V5C4_9ARAC|nr:hypothetical protein CDAR_105201 [Caerostris darwini]